MYDKERKQINNKKSTYIIQERNHMHDTKTKHMYNKRKKRMYDKTMAVHV